MATVTGSQSDEWMNQESKGNIWDPEREKEKIVKKKKE